MTREEKADILDSARYLFADTRLSSYAAEAEAVRFLQAKFKLRQNEIAGILGLTERQVKSRVTEYKEYAAKGLIPTGEVPVYTREDGLDPRQEVLADEDERQTRLASGREFRQGVTYDLFVERFVPLVAKHLPSERDLAYVDETYKRLAAERVSGDRNEEAAVIVMSDAHLGLVNPYFDYNTAKGAIRRFIDTTLYLTELHRTQRPVRKVYFCPLGDNVQGSSGNFPAQRWTVHDTAADQAEVLVEMSVETIEKLLVEYDEVIVVPRRGNHGNLYARKTSVEPEHANIETVAHRTLRWAFRDNARVKFILNDEHWYTVVNFMGVKALLTHGDAIPGAGSFDGVLNSFRKFNDILPQHDIAIIGHFHRLARLPMPMPYGSTKPRTLYMNGTAVRGDTHGEQYGAAHSNLWWMLFAGKDRITAEYPVTLYD